MKRKVIHQNSRFAYSTHTQQLTSLFLAIFDLFCLTSYPRFWTNSRKMSYLCRRKAALGNLKASFHCARLHFLCRRKPASQQNIQASLIFCIRFAFSLHRQPKKVWQEPLRGHLLRPRSVTIDDQRRSSIKTPKEHYSKADRRHRATNKTPDTRAVTNAPTIS